MNKKKGARLTRSGNQHRDQLGSGMFIEFKGNQKETAHFHTTVTNLGLRLIVVRLVFKRNHKETAHFLGFFEGKPKNKHLSFSRVS